MKKGVLLKNWEGFTFLDILYIKKLLPSLTELCENFRSGAIIFSRIVPNVLKIKTKLIKPSISWNVIYRRDWGVVIFK